MREDITPEESVAPVYLVEPEPEQHEPLNLGALELLREAERESAFAKLRALGLTDPEIAAILPQ